jgi:UDP-glucose 4-epimerase
MRKKYNNSKIKFYIGDVRDPESISSAINDVNFIFHAAALKQVPSCEFYPLEAVKTNILGTENVLDAAIRFGVNKIVVLSTDKAVYPVSAMGQTKALMEKVALAKSRTSGNTIITVTRYGNVIGSRGSVIPLFVQQIKSGKPITLTNPSMTRFMMTLEEAVNLVFFAFSNGKSGDIFVQKSPAATIQIIAEGIKVLQNAPDHPIQIIGTRHGEKLYETLLSPEELHHAINMEKYFRIPADTRDLNYDMFTKEGEVEIAKINEYNSHNTNHLNLNDFVGLVKKTNFLEDFNF